MREPDDGCEPDEGSTVSVLSREHGGKPLVLSEQCSTCIGRPGNLMKLRPGRVKQMVRDGVNGGGIVCHATLPGGAIRYEPVHPAICRWFYDTYGHLCNLFRIWGRIGGFAEIAPPTPKDGSNGTAPAARG